MILHQPGILSLRAGACDYYTVSSIGMSDIAQAEVDAGRRRLHLNSVSRIRVLLVDDHQMVSEAVAACLAATSDLWVLGRYAADDPRLADVIAQCGPDLITLGVRGAGKGSAALINTMRSAWPDAHVVAVAATDDPMVAIEAARAGVMGWISTNTSLEGFADTLRRVSTGQGVYPPELLGVVLRELRRDARRVRDHEGPLAVLSPREREVLLGMVEGRTGTQMALEMFLSANTVRTHSRAILTKLQVHSRLEAVAIARTAGMQPAAARIAST